MAFGGMKNIAIATRSPDLWRKIHISQKTNRKRKMELQAVVDQIKQGIDHQNAGRLAAARDCYVAVIDNQPRVSQGPEEDGVYARAHSLLGTLHYAFGEFEPAKACFREALDLAPGLVDAKLKLAILMAREANYGTSLNLLRDVLSSEPDNVSAVLTMGRVYKWQDELEDAQTVLAKAVGKFPNVPDVMVEYGIVAGRLGRLEQQLEYCDKALGLQPGHQQALVSRGIAMMELGQFDEAIMLADQLLATFPDLPPALALKATVLARADRNQDAYDAFNHLFSFAPALLDERLDYCTVCLRMGDVAAARASIEVLRQHHKNQMSIDVMDVRCDLAVGNAPEAREKLDQLAARAKDDRAGADVYMLLAQLTHDEGSTALSRVHVERAEDIIEDLPAYQRPRADEVPALFRS